VLDDDGSRSYLGPPSFTKCLSRLYFVLIEIPEGSWRVIGRQTSALEIGYIVGSDKDQSLGLISRSTSQNSKRHRLLDAILIGTM
jgi:hypothetical protein